MEERRSGENFGSWITLVWRCRTNEEGTKERPKKKQKSQGRRKEEGKGVSESKERRRLITFALLRHSASAHKRTGRKGESGQRGTGKGK